MIIPVNIYYIISYICVILYNYSESSRTRRRNGEYWSSLARGESRLGQRQSRLTGVSESGDETSVLERVLAALFVAAGRSNFPQVEEARERGSYQRVVNELAVRTRVERQR